MAVYNKIGFSVVLVNGQRYAANNIQHHFRGNHEDVVSFICSGTLITVPAKEVEHIEIGRGNQHCDSCDQRFPDNWIWDAMPEPPMKEE